MRRLLRVAFGLGAVALGWWLCSPALSQGPSDIGPGAIPPGLGLPGAGGGPDKKFEDFDKVVKGAKEYDGLFKLYQKDENLYAEIRQDQFDRPLLCPIALAKGGGGMAGFTLNFDEQWVLTFKRSSCAVWRPTAGPTGATSGRCTAASSTRCTSAS